MQKLVALLLTFLALGCISAQTLSHARARAPVTDGVYYEIFVRSFQDSDGDGIGDLRGITQRLDYLKELGITGIWLTPIFKSPSYHGYDTIDYRQIQPEYGTTADLDALVAAAHARGIRVLLDWVINHTSSASPWFKQHHDWYVWRDQDPGWPGPSRWHALGAEFFYAYFGSSMPDLNLTNEAVASELEDDARYWLGRGIDGFRLDAARYYIEGPQGESDTPETHALIARLATDLKAQFPSTTLVGEVWTDLETIAPYVTSGRELDLAFHFPLSGATLTALRSGRAADFSSALRAQLSLVPSPSRLAPFLTNHDMDRIASQLASERGSDSRLILAAATLLAQPGIPFLYYGEEIGMTNGAGGKSRTEAQDREDRNKRTPMQWERTGNHGFTVDGAKPWRSFSSEDPALSVEDQQGRKGSLWEAYRSLIAVRRAHEALGVNGGLSVLPDPAPGVAAFVRTTEQERVLVLLNFGASQAGALQLPISSAQPEVLWGDINTSKSAPSGTGAAARDGLLVQGLGPHAAAWIRL